MEMLYELDELIYVFLNRETVVEVADELVEEGGPVVHDGEGEQGLGLLLLDDAVGGIGVHGDSCLLEGHHCTTHVLGRGDQ